MEIQAEEISIKQVVRYYETSEKALRLFYQETNPLFLGYTRLELDNEFKGLIDELDKSASLTVLSAIEAFFRNDYIKRSKNKMKDHLSRSFRELYSIKKKKVSLPDEILKRWKQHADQRIFISNYISALHYRDWLAHGRYWSVRVDRKYDFYEVFSLAASLEGSLGLKLGAV